MSEEHNQNLEENLSAEHEIRVAKVHKMREQGIEPWPYRKGVEYTAKQVFDEFKEENLSQSYEEETHDFEATRNELDKAFTTLELESTATIDEVRRRYRELTLKYHPDRNKTSDTTQKMTQINNAVDLIMDYFRMGATA